MTITLRQIRDLGAVIMEREKEFDRIFGSAEEKIDQAIKEQSEKLTIFYDGKIGRGIREFLRISQHKLVLHSGQCQGRILELVLTPDGFESMWREGSSSSGEHLGCEGAISFLCSRKKIIYNNFQWLFSGYIHKHEKVEEVRNSLKKYIERISGVGDEIIGIILARFDQLSKSCVSRA